MRGLSFFLLLCIFATGLGARAEYRVFLLKITNTQNQDVRTVESTLDPEQYARYYPVLATEYVSYTETWRCYGRTDDFKPYCPNPKAQSPAPPANP